MKGLVKRGFEGEDYCGSDLRVGGNVNGECKKMERLFCNWVCVLNVMSCLRVPHFNKCSKIVTLTASFVFLFVFKFYLDLDFLFIWKWYSLIKSYYSNWPLSLVKIACFRSLDNFTFEQILKFVCITGPRTFDLKCKIGIILREYLPLSLGSLLY